MPFGKRRTSWLALQRCLAMIRRLLRGPANRHELIQAVRQAIGIEAYQTNPERTLAHDLGTMRQKWHVRVPYNRTDQAYHLEELSFPLVDVPDKDLTTLAFLYHNFPPSAPQGTEVRAFLDRLVGLLPKERRRQVLCLRTIPSLDLEVLDQGTIAPDVWSAVEAAVVQRQQLTFTYRPAHREKDEPWERQHRVEPYGVDLEGGHFYLEAYSLWVQIGEQRRSHLGTLRYRLSRIIPGTARVLPDKLPPGRRPMPLHTIRYRLGAAIVQGGVTARFPETEVQILDDGTAEVEAQTTNLWLARQVLLRYGQNCQVLAPAELVRMMRETVAGMAQVYEVQEAEGKKQEAGGRKGIAADERRKAKKIE